MKPIIIAVENGKISIPYEEFKRFMNEAYTQGYHDATSLTATSTNQRLELWWDSPYYTGTPGHAVGDSTKATDGGFVDYVTATGGLEKRNG